MKAKVRAFLITIIRFCLRNIKHKQIYFRTHRTEPLSRYFGQERGTAIDRFFIEKFLDKNKNLIKGKCLEIQEKRYLKEFGQNATEIDILDIDTSNKKATIFADLKNLSTIPNNSYNCIILTQVLQYVDDLEQALKECYRILQPGGVILATLPGISQYLDPVYPKKDIWRFTETSAEYFFRKVFLGNEIEIASFGNALVAQAFLTGLAKEEVMEKYFDTNHPLFPCVITVKATKPMLETNKATSRLQPLPSPALAV